MAHGLGERAAQARLQASLTFVTVPPSPPPLAVTRSSPGVAGPAVGAVTPLLAVWAEKSAGTGWGQAERAMFYLLAWEQPHWPSARILLAWVAAHKDI